MARLVALLRGINVGGHRVKMDDLKRACMALGLAEVQTFLASGNVLFTSAVRQVRPLEQRMERHLGQALGFATPVYVRTAAELDAVAGSRPFAVADLEDPGNSINVVFCRETVSSEAIAVLASLEGPRDRFHVQGREVYWLCRGKISIDSLAAPQLEKAFRGQDGTMRNWRTVQQLATLAATPVAPATARGAAVRTRSKAALPRRDGSA